jgi:hypothetical protein
LFVLTSTLVAVACGDDETSTVEPSGSSTTSSGTTTSGTSGSGGGTTVPTCADFCPQLVGADCEPGFTVADCEIGCGDMLSGPCDSFFKTYLLCADGASFTCDGTEAVAADCVTEEAALGSCVEQQGTGGGGQGGNSGSGGSGGN